MKVNSINLPADIYPKVTGFKAGQTMPANKPVQDEFVNSQNLPQKKKSNTLLHAALGALALGVGAILFYSTRKKPVSSKKMEFKSINDAKEFFEKIKIKTDFDDINEKHLPLLNKIRENIKELKQMGVKIHKPYSIIISDWSKKGEYENFAKKYGISTERLKNNHAFSTGKNEIFIDSNHPEFDNFKIQMGHANRLAGQDSYFQSKGIVKHDFADKQLEILSSGEKVYRSSHVKGSNLNNILLLSEKKSPSQFVFPNLKGEARFVNAKKLIDKIHSETKSGDGKYLSEEIANVFNDLINGKKFSDETMLYYDFAGGTRIPNLKIENKTYDEYIESLYNNKDLIQKLRNNVKISKI